MPDRNARIERATKETQILLSLRLDASGVFDGGTKIGFFDHMLDLLARHSGFDVTLQAKGDLQIDHHHTVEDVGIVLGEALARALGDKRSVRRFATIGAPLDEALSIATIDLSGRGGFFLHGIFPARKTGDFDCDLANDFFRSFAANGGFTLHLQLVSGENPHHIVETAFKAVALALRDAVAIDNRIVGIPSTKGVL